jgi:hypothetical protein
MAQKGNAGNGGGCAAILGLVLLVLTLGWPLFAFHRHWNTVSVINCATNPNADSANGCTWDWSTGNSTGTGTLATPHSAISATGWIVEVVWIGVLASGVALLAGSAARKRSQDAVTKGSSFTSGNGRRTVRDVIDPSLTRNDRNPASLKRDQLVKGSDLDISGKELLARAQQAISDVLTSRVYADNKLERDAAEPALRRHEWAAALDLREITTLRHEQARAGRSHAGSNPGPLTEAVLGAQDNALQQKLTKIESVVRAMEEYAGHVKAADLALKDLESATALAKLNERFTDLVVTTAADEVRLREAEDMTKAAEVFRETLIQANLASRALFLPATAADHDH